MWLSSRRVAFLLALSIAIVTTAFLSLVEGVQETALFVTALLAFSSTYILTSFSLELLIFREINKIYKVLNKLRKRDVSFIEEGEGMFLNPLKRINKEINSYAALKQREIEELRQLAAFRREFLADVSHELKTPIFAAQGYIHTLLDGADEDEEIRRKFLTKAAKSLDGLDILVHDLLTISHLESGDLKFNFAQFDICEVTQEVFDQLERKAEKKQIELAIGDDCEEVLVYGDRQRIYQVIMNLVANAVNYTQESGKVVVKFIKEGGQIKIDVCDNGPGIAEEHIDRIFERFYRVDKSRARLKGGTGLGLAIVKHIVEAHNSTIHVKSKSGKGTTFTFKLPQKAKKKAEAKA
jgi:two-component system, OmpR family, phosphate regulon sensor histidine kinase PhoR